jgi:threonylcarbamoyladenosine tRNA methylthiotransferase MtaB
MSKLFRDRGYEVVHEDQPADVYVINTCTVTNLGDRKSRAITRRARRQNPMAVIAVVGCYAQVAAEEVMGIDGVNLVLGTNERMKIVDFVEDLGPGDKVSAVGDIMEISEFEELKIDEHGDRTRAFIKIQEGCNQYCSYCIIPYARGRVRSRVIGNVEAEVIRLVGHGFKEFVLTGIHIASYGREAGSLGLIDVIERVNAIPGVKRLRLGSLEPTMMTPEFIKRLRQLESVCPHFHLSLQSGSDQILKRMNRQYTSGAFLEVVNHLKAAYDRPSLTTDIIVGFPGETEAMFEETMAFVKRVGFSKIHVFQYSAKTGTPAAKMKDQVDSQVKSHRSELLIALQNDLETRYNTQWLGTIKEVLFEGLHELGMTEIEGLTTDYLRVKVKAGPEYIGKTVQVLLETLTPHGFLGKIVEEVQR